MKKIVEKRIATTIFALFLVVMSMFLGLPQYAEALGFMPFGGFVTYVLPCTCSGNFWLQMSPFYSPTPGTGALVYNPASTIVYERYAIPVVGVWLLGDYVPGVQACFITIPHGCMMIPSYGVIHQTGTGL